MDVRFYETKPGSSPVLDHLRSLPREQRQIVGQAIRELQDKPTFAAARVDVRPLSGKLWEVRASYQRVLYVVAKGGTIWLLLAYEKDTQKTPDAVLETARRRMKEVLERSR